MRKIGTAARRALRGNRGSGIVLVLVCMLCVSILGVTALYLSYTGLLLKVTERRSKADFYDATTAMDEIRAGVQTAASDSIAGAYKSALINYSNPAFTGGSDMSAGFQREFRNELYGWKDEAGDALFITSGGTYRYSTDVLKSFVSDSNTAVSVRDGKAAQVVYDTGKKTVLLKNVDVVYTNPRTHYTTEVSADISVGMPDFSYVVSQYSISGLPEFAVIAKDTLLQDYNNTQLVVDGSAYASRVLLKNEGSSLDIKRGTVVCAGLLSVNNAGPGSTPRLTVEDGASLWTNRIEVGASSSAVLDGRTYVKDDLELAGAASKASLGGSFYGFGNSLTAADQSSAILVNGRNTTLDLSGLSRLMLAGRSFVSNYKNAADSVVDVPMGESVSVRGNQEAYLAPAASLDGVSGNPWIFSGTAPAVTLKSGTSPWSGKTLADYGASLKPVYTKYPGTQQTVAYYFLQFDTAEHTNQYFKDYFSNNSGEISSYLDAYTSLSSVSGLTQSAGYTVEKNADGTYALGSYVTADSLVNSAAQMQSTFTQLTTTLFDRVSVSTNPYDYFVRADEIDAKLLPSSQSVFEFSDSAGAVVGLIVRGDYMIDGTSPEALRVVIATGSVIVKKEFHGLIIAGSNINMQNSVFAKAEEVTSAFSSACTVNGESLALSSFLRAGVADNTESGGSGTGSALSWNLDKLVSYQNWNKS